MVHGSVEERFTLGRTGSFDFLDRTALQQSNAESVVNALRMLPGISVSRAGGAGGVSSIYLRGGEANFVPVLINGIQVNDPGNSRGGAYDFDNLDLQSIDRIELVRGAQSAVYGSDSLSGLVNVVTARGQQSQRVLLQLGGTSEGGKSAGARIHAPVNNGSLTLGARSVDAGESVEGYTHDADYLDLSYHSSDDAKSRLSAFARMVDADRSAFPEDSGGPELAASRRLDEGETQEVTFGVNASREFVSGMRVHAKVGWHEIQDKLDSPGIAPFDRVPPNYTDSEFRRRTAAVWGSRSGAWGQIRLGMDTRYEDGSSDGFVEFFGTPIESAYSLEREQYGVFAEIQSELVGAELSASVRVDHADEFDEESALSVGVSYPFASSRSRISVNWNEGYKLPSFFALGNSLVGNPSLQPERSRGWELQYEHQFRETPANLRFTYFDNDYQDLIDFDPESFTNLNRSRVSAKGLESRLQWIIGATLDLAIHSTYVDYDAPAGVRLRGRPDLKFGATIAYKPTEKVEVFTAYRRVGEVYQSSLVTGFVELEEYDTLDFTSSISLENGVSIALSVDNVLNNKYREAVGTPSPERLFRMIIRYEI